MYNLLHSTNVQISVAGKDGTPQPSVLPPPGSDKLKQMEETEEGMYVGQNANMSKKSQYGGENGVPLAGTVEEEVEEQGLYSVVNKQREVVQSREAFYSRLGEPDLRDLPSFAHQISQGMVSEVNSKILTSRAISAVHM